MSHVCNFVNFVNVKLMEGHCHGQRPQGEFVISKG